MANTKTKKNSHKSPNTTGNKKSDCLKHTNSQLMVISVFSIGMLLCALSVIKGQNVWFALHKFFLGMFGVGAYIFGPVMVYVSAMAALDKPVGKLANKIWQILIFIILISGVIQIFGLGMPQSEGLFLKFKEIYAGGIALKGGGIASLILGLPLYSLFGKTAAGFTLILMTFVFLMIITGSTLASFFHSAVKPVKKLEEVYSEKIVESKEIKENKKSKFNIDIPVDDENHVVVTSPKGSIRAESAAAKAKADDMIKSELTPQTEPQPEIDVSPIQKPNPLMDIIHKATSRHEASKKAEVPQKDEQTSTALLEEDDISRLVNRAVETVPCEESAGSYDQFNFDIDESEITVENIDEILDSDPFEELPQALEAMDSEPAYIFPVVGLLNEVKITIDENLSEELRENADKLVNTLKSFGVSTKITDICKGPAVTRYELQPSAGVKISKITNLADDIALNLASAGVRIEAPIPNKPAVGIEVPNKKVDMVSIREVIDSKEFRDAKSRLTIALGKDVAGNIATGDISKMPHVLIAGATGSGKSVCINSIILSILYKSSPDEVKLIMVDPKVVELGTYNGIPHLLIPVVTDPRKAAGALAWAVTEMTGRYNTFATNNVRDLKGYNKLAEKSDTLKPMPQIVIIIDELADLMMAAPNEVEDSICRLAQMARAAGMHLVIATQRPSVDVITGVIKANIPSRIAFAVSSQVDSRTILDTGGAEKLLGKGDMLFAPVGAPKPLRVQGCFVSDEEVEQVVEFIKQGGQETIYDAEVMEEIERQAVIEKDKKSSSDGGGFDDNDEMFPDAVEAVLDAGQASTSYLQRKLRLGYARAARLIDTMEEQGIVGGYEGSKPRQVLITRDMWIEMKMNKLD